MIKVQIRCCHTDTQVVSSDHQCVVSISAGEFLETDTTAFFGVGIFGDDKWALVGAGRNTIT